MIREFANLFETTVRELALAARRIERQSGLVLRARMRLRKWHRKVRKLRRRLSRQPMPTETESFCDWRAREAKYGRLFWECRRCGRTTLHPTGAAAQARAGEYCRPDAEANQFSL